MGIGHNDGSHESRLAFRVDSERTGTMLDERSHDGHAGQGGSPVQCCVLLAINGHIQIPGAQ